MNNLQSNQITATVYGASFVDVEGKQYVSLYLGQPSSDSKRYKGIEIMKMNALPDLYASIPDNTQFPAAFNLTFELTRASGGRMGQICISATPVRAAAASASNKA